MRAMRAAAVTIAAALIVVLTARGPVGVQRVAAAGSNAVTDWALISQNAVIVGRPAGSGFYLQAIVLVAINDAVAAVDGGTRPLVGSPPVSRPADADAAVAAAARDVLVARVPGQAATVQSAYDAYLAGITDGAAKTNGIAVGHAAATAVLADRADDNFDVDPPYVQPTPGPGVFEPVLPTKPVDIKMGDVKPIVLPNAEDFVPGPPPALTSEEYAVDFAEVKALGRKTGSTRTPQQTETALFWSENTVVQLNRTFRELALERGVQQGRNGPTDDDDLRQRRRLRDRLPARQVPLHAVAPGACDPAGRHRRQPRDRTRPGVAVAPRREPSGVSVGPLLHHGRGRAGTGCVLRHGS